MVFVDAEISFRMLLTVNCLEASGMNSQVSILFVRRRLRSRLVRSFSFVVSAWLLILLRHAQDGRSSRKVIEEEGRLMGMLVVLVEFVTTVRWGWDKLAVALEF